jgi:hypothetical protein
MARVREKTRPWKETIALVLAIAAAEVSHRGSWIFRGVLPAKFAIPAVQYALAVVFLVLAIVAVLGISGKTQAIFKPRVGSAHAAVIRYALLLVGFIVTLVITLQLFQVPVGQLVVGTALTSVLLGIAAQQSLSNIFAGFRASSPRSASPTSGSTPGTPSCPCRTPRCSPRRSALSPGTPTSPQPRRQPRPSPKPKTPSPALPAPATTPDPGASPGAFITPNGENRTPAVTGVCLTMLVCGRTLDASLRTPDVWRDHGANFRRHRPRHRRR